MRSFEPIGVAMIAVITACGPRTFPPSSPVQLAPPAPGADSGLALLYDAKVCSVDVLAGWRTIRWLAPRAPWRVQTSGVGAVRLGFQPLPPGHYELVTFTATDDYTVGQSIDHAELGDTECGRRSLHTRAIHFAFDVAAGQVAVATVPGGAPTLTTLAVDLRDRELTAGLEAWLTSIATGLELERRALVAATRTARDGYDLYRDCDGARVLAVVRVAGVALDRKQPIAGFLPNGVRRGCVADSAITVEVDDARDFDRAATTIGEWLVAGDRSGEVQVVTHLQWELSLAPTAK
jgi:hypothetical protein